MSRIPTLRRSDPGIWYRHTSVDWHRDDRRLYYRSTAVHPVPEYHRGRYTLDTPLAVRLLRPREPAP